MRLLKTLKFILQHPMNTAAPTRTLFRFFHWQIQSRIFKQVSFNWIDGTKLIVRNGMTGATGNIYCGLHEYADMAFVLHLLRADDEFVDVGANVGTYTILASGVCGARTLAIEPDPSTIRDLNANVTANRLQNLVETAQTAVGTGSGTIQFTKGLDTTNQVAPPGSHNVQSVPITSLDDLLANRAPTLIKMDVEGYETEVLLGAEKTLENPSLLAIEIETADPQGIAILEQAGFTRAGYDPVKKVLIDPSQSTGSNALFVRNSAAIIARLNAAPVRTYRGQNI